MRTQNLPIGENAIYHGVRELETPGGLILIKGFLLEPANTICFQVIDNGVEQKVESVDLNRLPIDLKLVFDTSGSISPEGLEKYRRAMRRVADALQPNDRCEIVAFTSRINDAAARQSPPIAIDLQRTLPDGTSFFDAVSLALVTVPSIERRQIVIVLSDAQDNASFFD